MAVASFVMLVRQGSLERVNGVVAGMEGLTVHDSGEPNHLVIVAERPSDELQGLERELKGIDGVLAMPIAYLNMEDELEGAGQGPGLA